MRNIAPHNIEEMSGNSICQESPGKHPGNTRHKRSRFRKKQTSLAILVGILNKEKEKNNAPGKHPGNSRGKVYLLMFSIKGAGLET